MGKVLSKGPLTAVSGLGRWGGVREEFGAKRGKAGICVRKGGTQEQVIDSSKTFVQEEQEAARRRQQRENKSNTTTPTKVQENKVTVLQGECTQCVNCCHCC